MASIGSLPFVIDTVIDGSSLLHSVNSRRPKLIFLANRPRTNCLNDSTFGCSKIVGENISRLYVCGRVVQKRIHSLRATSKGSDEGEDGDESEDDALQATIEKSKKVLALQRGLLQEVVFL